MTHRFRPRLLRLLMVAVLCGCAAAVALGFGELAGADAGRKAEAAGEDSPWPRTNAVRPNMRVLAGGARSPWRAGRAHGAVGGELRGLADLPQVRSRQRAGRPRSAVRLPLRRARWDRRRLHGRDSRRQAAPVGPRGLPVHPLQPCSRLPEREPAARRDRRACVGSRSRQFDNRDLQCALASPLQRRSRPGPASGQLARLERKAARLFARSQRLETISERFDEWESCVSWVPVTEMGDPDQKFGYLYGHKGAPAGYRAALHIDRSRLGRPGLHVPRAGGR